MGQGGEGGIRTLDGGFPPYSLSRRVPSATRPPLREGPDGSRARGFGRISCGLSDLPRRRQPDSERRPPRLDEDTLEAQQELLALEAAGIAAECPARPQHAVAGHHDRHRVGAEGVAGGADRAGAPGAAWPSRRRWWCGRSRPPRWRAAPRVVNPLVSAQSIGRSKSVRLALEVLVELAAESSSRPGASSMRGDSLRAMSSSTSRGFRTACTPRAPGRAAWKRPPAGRAASRPWRRPRRAAPRRRRARPAISRSGLGQALSRRCGERFRFRSWGPFLSESLEALEHVAPSGVLAMTRGGLRARRRAFRARCGRRRRCAAWAAAARTAAQSSGSPFGERSAAAGAGAVSGTDSTGTGRRERARCRSIALFCAIRKSQARRFSVRRSFG